jgi:hypothetical protein
MAFEKRHNLRLVGVVGVIAATAMLLGTARPAHADVIAAYLQGHGGLASPELGQGSGGSSGVTPGLGVQAGARLLIFEVYGDHTSFGGGSSVQRGILGLRAALGFGGVRLILRGGGGVIAEHGGALTGRLDGTPDRSGAVVRAGVALEKQVARMTMIGFGLDGEAFSVAASGVPAQSGGIVTGSDVFVSLHLKFELGI